MIFSFLYTPILKTLPTHQTYTQQIFLLLVKVALLIWAKQCFLGQSEHGLFLINEVQHQTDSGYFHLLRFNFKKCCLDLSKERSAELFGKLPSIEPLYLLSGMCGRHTSLLCTHTEAHTCTCLLICIVTPRSNRMLD